MPQPEPARSPSPPRPDASSAEDPYAPIQRYYNRFYSRTDIHYALWEEGTKSQEEAIRNTSRTVCGLLDIREGQLVLDAGCGLGGTSIYLAQRYGARVEGVDCSPSNLEQARKNAAAAGAAHMIAFSNQDHRQTGFPDAHFDHVIAIESLVASDTATAFLKEAHRVLKQGGDVAIVAMHLGRSSGGAPLFERRHGSHLAFDINRSSAEFCHIIESVGFREARAIDLMSKVRLASRTFLAVPILGMLALSKIGLVHAAMGDHLRTLLETERAMATGSLGLALFVGRK